MSDSSTAVEADRAQGTVPPANRAAKAKCAVAEYLRDLGLGDPDVLARESQRIVDEAQQGLSTSDASDESLLCEAAVGLTVKRLEHWLEVLATQSGGPDGPQRWGSVIAARLPMLLNRFPDALNQDVPPAGFVDSLRGSLTPVVPSPRPGRMGQQRLSLVPTSLRRLANRIRKLSLRKRGPTEDGESASAP